MRTIFNDPLEALYSTDLKATFTSLPSNGSMMCGCPPLNSSIMDWYSEAEADDILLHRYVAGLAPKRSKIINKNEAGEVLALDVALPRNCESWYEIIPDLIFRNSIESFQMAHFMCMVFHWDFVLKKGKDVEKIKKEILNKLDDIGAKYPAEHNVGHLYKANEDLESFYKKLDPSNSFNAGVGQLSKNKFYRD